MDPEPPRELTRRRVAVARASLIALAIAAGLTWWALERDDESAGSSVGPTVVAAPAAMPVPAAVEAASSAPERVVASADTAATDEIQVCGGSWLKLGADGQPSEESAIAVSARATEEAASAALAAMTASASPRSQAAAHYFRAGRAGMAKFLRSSCDSDESCLRMASTWQSDGEGQRDALARLAQDSDDAQVYAWAYRACKAAPAADRGACQLVNASQWARLDPLNAEPWLELGAEAQSRKDAPAFEDAMFHVASAEHYEAGWGALSAALIDHLPGDDASLIGTLGLISEGIGAEAMNGIALAPVSRYCGASELVDPNRRETCERIANLLVERSTTIIARAIGVGIGKRLGWPGERLDALAQQRDAEAAVQQIHGAEAEANPLACATLRRRVDRWRDTVQVGEIEAVRRDVVASGKPAVQLATEYRRSQVAEKARTAGQAASGPEVASEGRATDATQAIR